MRLATILHNPPPPIRLQRIFKLPERIPAQIGADEVGFAPGETQRFPFEPELLDESGSRGRHEYGQLI